VTFPDEHVLARRLRQLHRLPWPIPASVVIWMRADNFDRRDIAKHKRRCLTPERRGRVLEGMRLIGGGS
jgi:hypothetical protein